MNIRNAAILIGFAVAALPVFAVDFSSPPKAGSRNHAAQRD